jgi:hypothetical protein
MWRPARYPRVFSPAVSRGEIYVGSLLVLCIALLVWLSQRTLGARARDAQAKSTILSLGKVIDAFEVERRGVISNVPGEGPDRLTDTPLSSTLDDLFATAPTKLQYGASPPTVPSGEYRFRYYVPETPPKGERQLVFTSTYLLYTNLVEDSTLFVTTFGGTQSSVKRDPSLSTLTLSSCESDAAASTSATIVQLKDQSTVATVTVPRSGSTQVDLAPGLYRIRFPTRGVVPSRIFTKTEETAEGLECSGDEVPGTVPSGGGLPVGFVDIAIPGDQTVFASRLLRNEELLVNGKPILETE